MSPDKPTPAGKPESAGKPRPADTPPKKAFPAFPILLALLTLALIVYVVWRLDTAPGTDDAYAFADTIDVVPEVSGKIVNLPIRDNQAVKEGDLLFEVDPRSYQDALDAARATLVQLDKQIEQTRRTIKAQEFAAAAVEASVERARAAADQATDTLHRMEPLLEKGFVTAEDVDQARTRQQSTKAALEAVLLEAKQAKAAIILVDPLVAQRAVIEAEIATAELNLEFTKVHAPFDGRVVALDTSEGQFVSALKPVFTLIDTRRWYVVANFREAELKNIHPGTQGTVYLMADTDKKFVGAVDSIGFGVHPDDGGTELGGLPYVRRSVNWVRVAQRFPVKILVENPDPELFRIGASAVVTLYRAKDSGREEK
jgi:multidrug efflux system membrane fusion protein